MVAFALPSQHERQAPTRKHRTRKERIIKSGIALAICCSLFLSTTVTSFSDDQSNIERLTKSNTQFALDLYSEIKSREGNLFFSPYSISNALAMTYAGARAETAKQISSALHVSMGDEELHAAFAAIQARLRETQQEKQIELSISNSFWPHDEHPFLREYLELLRKYYDAEVIPVDFRSNPDSALRQVNSWIEKKTNGKIKGGVSGPLPPYPQTRLILANAIYFKGEWVSRFEKRATNEMPFYLSNSRTTQVPMMQQTSDFYYGEDNSLQVLEMPYTGADLSMVVVLPREIDGLPTIEQTLTIDKLMKWTEDTSERPVTVFFPRFNMIWHLDLKATLAAMGVTNAFDENKGNFAGMDGFPEGFISFAQHDAFIDVYEEGTEAAAATVGGGGCFPAGTQVLTPSGPRDIEVLSAGAAVYAYDMKARQWTVTRIRDRESRTYEGDIIAIHAGPITVEATGNHPFFVLRGDSLASRPLPQDVPEREIGITEQGRWVEARDLKASDVLLDRSGEGFTISNISTRSDEAVVYNLHIEDHHNYAVTQRGILVHNKAGAEEQPVIFRADHPFLFLIRHKETGTILFIGRLSDPSSG